MQQPSAAPTMNQEQQEEQQLEQQLQLQHSSNSNNSNKIVLHRPTEAQLRWAQFHHKRSAARVQQQVQRLMLQPASVCDVPGALPDDGEEKHHNHDTHNHDATTSIHISKGRRAMLRVSQRALEKRRQYIETHGFRWDSSDAASGTGVGVDAAAVGETAASSCDYNNNNNVDDEEDALAAIFAEENFRKNRRRRRKRKKHGHNNNNNNNTSSSGYNYNAERVRRFEAAFYAMLQTLAAAQQPTSPQIAVPTKKWERPEHHSSLTKKPLLFDENNFTDLKWGVMRKQSNKNPSQHYWMNNNNTTVPDRGASWLVHVPPKGDKNNNTKRQQQPEQQPQSSSAWMTDEMRQQLTNVARQYLVDHHENDDDDNSNNNKEHHLPDHGVDDDVASLVEHLERHYILAEDISNNNNNNETSVNMANLLARFEPNKATTATAAATHQEGPAAFPVNTTTPATANSVRRLEQQEDLGTTTTMSQEDRNGFVKQLVAQMEAVIQEEPLVWTTIEGKRHKPTFARLVQRYLEQLERTTYRSGATGKKLGGDAGAGLAGGDEATHQPSPSLVRRLIEEMERDDEVGTIVTSEGTLDKAVFERLVHRYLAKDGIHCARDDGTARSTTTTMEDQLHDDEKQRPESSAAKELTPSSAPQGVLHALPGTVSRKAANSRVSGFFSRIGKVREKVIRYRSGAPADAAAATAATAVSNDDEVATTSEGDRAQTSAADGTVSNKVVELFHSLHTGRYAVDQAGLQEYSAFRQAQDERHHANDDGSSLSSFRVLPAGLRRVVERVRGAQLSPRDEEDGDNGSEHKRMDSFDSYPDSEKQENSLDDSRSGFISSSQGGPTSSTLSPDNFKDLQEALIGSMSTSEDLIIDTDGNSEGTGGMPTDTVASLMLSPTLLTKRHQQAIRAVENRKWDQVTYLLSANPWLAEMADVATSQYILHKLAFFGAGSPDEVDYSTGDVINPAQPAAPEKLYMDCVRMFPSAVHKFDKDGDLPLHMAAATANLPMIKLLGDRFPSGASVRNEDGMLPVHLAILACASQAAANLTIGFSGRDVVRVLIDYFPGAIAVVDNEGNLPIHTAATVLRGGLGASIVYFLIDEAERQIMGPSELRFRIKRTVEEIENESSTGTESTDPPTDSSNQADDTTNCLLVRNELHDTPLAAAVYSGAGWEVVEALTCRDAATQALDAEGNNALHLLVSERYQDPAAALVVLKLIPQSATMRNESGMLPIEIACMQSPSREVILALAIVDLPVNLDQPNDTRIKQDFGASWWYLTCECDDFYVDIVEEIISLCTFQQVRALSLWKNGSPDSLLARATPQCRNVLSSAMRFVGKYEFIESSPIYSDAAVGLMEFNVLDYGELDNPLVEGRRVVLKCFIREEAFQNETSILRDLSIDPSCFEEIETFTVSGDDPSSPLPQDGQQRFFVAIERPDITLSGVVRGMLGSTDCQNDMNVRQRYTIKVFSVLRLVAKRLRLLHIQGFIHGDLCLENCGKFDDDWKLSDLLGSQRIGRALDANRLSSSAPPESVKLQGKVAAFRSDLIAHPSLDSWAFGKVAFEVLVGDTLIEFDVSKSIETDHESLAQLLNWSDVNTADVRQELQRVGVTEAGVSLVVDCLSPIAEGRPTMDEILAHSLWNALRHQSS